ncbi:hypothetical protein AB1K62_14285 [Parasphingorhabdus sp. JC815]|uniref:hypothetical protein n=1 Tax=Parasphingorhabdus sp. JC815 TaxID=3232140 RepID=UPI003457AE8B
MKKALYFVPMILAGGVLMALTACEDEPNTQPQNPPVWDENNGPNPADECPRADGGPCL